VSWHNQETYKHSRHSLQGEWIYQKYWREEMRYDYSQDLANELLEEADNKIEELQEWKNAVEELCIVNCINMTTPKETLQRLIQWEVTQALDPRISKAAEDLIEQGRKQRW
jgi:hypothetical protein